jgi:ABC-type nitrate/sulfonate/bicarbonate transport system substrate-binding protein
LTTLAFTACSNDDAKTAAVNNQDGIEKLVLNHQSTAGFISFPELAEDLGYLAPIKLNYLGNIIGGPQDLQALATGDVDFATAFNGAIIKLAASGVDIVTLVGSYGSDTNTAIGFYVPEDSPIKSARDLIGKKISVNTLGAHAEFVIKEYLSRGGLSKAEIDQVELTVLPPVNSEQALRGNQVDVAQLQNILRDKALERGGIRALFTDVELYGDFTAGNYTVTRKFLKENPNTVRKFVDGTARAIEWARTTPREEVVARYTEIINKRGRNEDARLVQFWKSTGIADKGGLITPNQYQQWIDWLVQDGQLAPNKIKASDLYDNSFNPYNVSENNEVSTSQK